MSASNRRIKIFELLTENKKVEVNTLAKYFDCTTMTIRRDLALLEKQGVVTCYYGGAILNEGASSEPSFQLKNSQSLDAKIAIGYWASKQVNDGDTIYLDCGTTIYTMSRFLTNKKISVITNSWSVVEVLKNSPKIEIILAPGIYNRTSNGAVSAATVNFLKQHHVNKAFLSCQGFDINLGPSNPNEMDVEIKNTALAISDKTYLLVDHTKFKVNCTFYQSSLNEYFAIVCDEGLSKKDEQEFKNKKLPLVIAPLFSK